MTNKSQSRRSLLQSGALLTGLVAVSKGAFAAEACKPRTALQPKGPFYPVTRGSDLDADMTRLQNSEFPAAGQVIDLLIAVKDLDCNPIADATVDLWQACDSGKYNHPDDPNDAFLDPNFQYHAVLSTDVMGNVRVRTVKPGAYPASDSWVRPPHIHIKVTHPKFPTLVTQMYFEGEALNKGDNILNKLSESDRYAATVKLVQQVSKPSEGTLELILGRKSTPPFPPF